jgi:hypothetical protein
MNTRSTALAVLTAAVLAGCHGTTASNMQMIRLDSDTSLAIVVNGAQTLPSTVASVLPGPQPGDPIRRFLKSADGKILFAYDLQVKKSAGGSYQALLKPASSGPTFAAIREVALPGPDEGMAQVELMEQPSTGSKIVDGFRIFRGQSLHSQLLAMHNQFYRWVHGD